MSGSLDILITVGLSESPAKKISLTIEASLFTYFFLGWKFGEMWSMRARSLRSRQVLFLAQLCAVLCLFTIFYQKFEEKRSEADLLKMLEKGTKLLEKTTKHTDCEPECHEDAMENIPYVGLVHDKESAFNLFDRANKRLSSILPQDPDWESYPPQLVLDPNSKEGIVDSAMKVKIYDPMETADFNREDGANLELRSIQRGVRDATGCEAGDKNCLDDFMFRYLRERKAWGYNF